MHWMVDGEQQHNFYLAEPLLIQAEVGKRDAKLEPQRENPCLRPANNGASFKR